jgi:hypothetical protein
VEPLGSFATSGLVENMPVLYPIINVGGVGQLSFPLMDLIVDPLQCPPRLLLKRTTRLCRMIQFARLGRSILPKLQSADCQGSESQFKYIAFYAD